jgi:hypothetical protein
MSSGSLGYSDTALLYGSEFVVETGHNPLRWLDTVKEKHLRVTRGSPEC